MKMTLNEARLLAKNPSDLDTLRDKVQSQAQGIASYGFDINHLDQINYQDMRNRVNNDDKLYREMWSLISSYQSDKATLEAVESHLSGVRKDMLGNPYGIGDEVVYPSVSGSSAYLTTAMVTALHPNGSVQVSTDPRRHDPSVPIEDLGSKHSVGAQSSIAHKIVCITNLIPVTA